MHQRATLRMNIPKIIDIFRPLKQATPVDWRKTYLVNQSRWSDSLKQGFGIMRIFLKLGLKPAWTQIQVYWRSYWRALRLLYILYLTLDSMWQWLNTSKEKYLIKQRVCLQFPTTFSSPSGQWFLLFALACEKEPAVTSPIVFSMK